MKKLSIVIPCYNESKSIPYLLEQFTEVIGTRDIEVILVDNGSVDETPAVLAALLPRYQFVKTTRVDKNQGYGFGILSGLRIGTGDFLGWMHADLQSDRLIISPHIHPSYVRFFRLLHKSCARLVL